MSNEDFLFHVKRITRGLALRESHDKTSLTIFVKNLPTFVPALPAVFDRQQHPARELCPKVGCDVLIFEQVGETSADVQAGNIDFARP